MTVTNTREGVGDAPVVELRQYTLKPGMTDALVDVFEAHFIEGQELTGMRIGGIFRDLDRPEKFVWMRGFDDMAARRFALDAFYTGPVWKEHGPTANNTMLDSDDVLLLRPTRPPHPPLPPGPVGTRVLVNVSLHEPGHGTCEWLAAEAQPVLESVLGTAVATWRTEPAANTFPALPVRDDHAFVWAATFAAQLEQDRALGDLDESRDWQLIQAAMSQRVASTTALRLAPTLRSRHPGAGTR
jgi:hypothetical protein